MPKKISEWKLPKKNDCEDCPFLQYNAKEEAFCIFEYKVTEYEPYSNDNYFVKRPQKCIDELGE